MFVHHAYLIHRDNAFVSLICAIEGAAEMLLVTGLGLATWAVRQQLSVIKRGADEVLVEAELVNKLERGLPLRIRPRPGDSRVA